MQEDASVLSIRNTNCGSLFFMLAAEPESAWSVAKGCWLDYVGLDAAFCSATFQAETLANEADRKLLKLIS